MYDAACPSDPLSDSPVFQRAVGALSVSFKRRGTETVLDGLRQEGCLKARFPRVEPTEWSTAVTLNTSGGVAGGDRLSSAFGVGEGAQACIAAQAAERFYRSVPGGPPSEVRTRVTVASGGTVEWLPQETILFDRCALDRRLEVDLASDGRFLGVESLVFGRTAMGERVEQAWLRDVVRVWRGGTLVLHDAIRLDGAVDALLQRPAVGGGARAVATLVYVAPDAEARLEGVREALGISSVISGPGPDIPTDPVASDDRSAPQSGPPRTPGSSRNMTEGAGVGSVSSKSHPSHAEAAASAWNGMLLARILASDSAMLRRSVAAALAMLRGVRPLPRVWMC
jgi:urease accessory protein